MGDGTRAASPTNDKASTGGSSQAEPFPTRLELELPVGCGSPATFVDSLHARSTRIRFTERGADRTVLARVTAESNGLFRATMTLLYPDGHSSSRIIEANTCAEAVEALALVTAVALDPLSITTSGIPSAAFPAAPSPTPLKQESRRKLAPRSSHSPIEKPHAEVDSDPFFGVGASFTAFRGPAPSWLKAVEPSVRWISGGASGLVPSVRVGFAYGESRGVSAGGGVADFKLTSLMADLCPAQLRHAAFELRGCAVLHAGLVFAHGRLTETPESHRRQYWAAGGSIEVAVLPSKSLAIPVRAMALAPLIRDAYAFSPEVFYRVPVATFGFSTGLEVRFR